MVAGDESQGDRIDAVASVLGRHSFSAEDMSQVAVAIVAHNFGAKAIRVEMTVDGAGDLVIEAGPAAMTVELVLGAVKRRVASPADERARFLPIGVLAGERPFCALADDDARFFRRQFVELRGRQIGIHQIDSPVCQQLATTEV